MTEHSVLQDRIWREQDGERVLLPGLGQVLCQGQDSLSGAGQTWQEMLENV